MPYEEIESNDRQGSLRHRRDQVPTLNFNKEIKC